MLQLIDDQTASNYYNEIDTATGDDLQSKTVALEAWANNKKAVQARQEWDHVSKVFTDFDNYSAAEGLDDFDEESRYQYANRKFIANQTGDTPENQMFVYPSKRDEVTDKLFGKTGLSEKEAFDLFKHSVESRTASEEALRELPGVLAQGVLKRAGEGKPFDEVDSWFAFSDWKERHADKLASMPKGWETAMLDSAVKLHARTEQLMDDVAPESKRAMDTLMKFTRPEDAESLPEADRADVENLAKDFAKLTPEQRDGIYATLSYAAEANGAGMGKGFWEKVGEGIARGGGNIYDDAAITAQDRQARQNISFFQDLIDKPQAEPDRMQTADSIQMQRDMAQKGLEENKQRLGELRVMREIRDLAQGRIDPIKTEMDGVLGSVVQGAYDFSQSAAYTGMAMVPYVGLPAVMGALANSNYLRMLDQYPDMDADAAFDLSLAIAGPQAIAERFQAGLLLGKLPFLGKAMKKLTDARVPLPARIGLGYGAVVGLETGTELVQEAMPIVADQLASAVREDMPEFDAGKAWGAYRDQAPKIFYSMLWGGLMGGGAVGIRELERSGVYMRDLQELEMHGITGEAAQNIAAEQDADKATALYREAWDKRSPEDIQAGIAKRAAMLDAAQATQANPDFPTRRIEENPDGTLTHIIEQNGQAIYSTTDPAAADIALIKLTRRVVSNDLRSDRFIVSEVLDQWTSEDPTNVVVESDGITAQQKLEKLQAAGNVAQIEELHRRIATSEYRNTPYDQINILGEATVEDLGEMVFRGVVTLNENSRPEDAREEIHHVAVRKALMKGSVTLDTLRGWLDATETALPDKFPGLIRENENDIVESLARVQRAYEDGTINAEEETRLPASFVDYIKRMLKAFKEVLQRAVALRSAFKDGILPAGYESFLADSVGLNQQARVDTARERVGGELTQGNFNYSIGSMAERIAATAVIDKDGKILSSPLKTHAQLMEESAFDLDGGEFPPTQNFGFVTTAGRFVLQKEAQQLAQQAKQVQGNQPISGEIVSGLEREGRLNPEVDPLDGSVSEINKILREVGDQMDQGLTLQNYATRDDLPEFQSSVVDDAADFADYLANDLAPQFPKEFANRIKSAAGNIQSQAVSADTGVTNYSIGTTPFKGWFGDWENDPQTSSKVVDQDGKPQIVFHGTQRPDRVGDRFRKSRATSGPMAYFTSDPEVASSYATGKMDTSMEMPSDYAGWFKWKGKGMRSPVNIDQAWWNLSQEERATIKDRIYTVGYADHEEATGDIVSDSQSIMSRDSIDYELRQAKGNALRALVDMWLASGTLYNQEDKFLEVLQAAGVKGATLDDPNSVRSAVYPVYLDIKNPLDTADIPTDVISALEQAGKRKRVKQSAGKNADSWDKNTISGNEWMAALKEDIAKGTTHAWTRIPDWVTETLSNFGYDGIKDTGGKRGGVQHQVWIPFNETQVKSATGNRGTFDPTSPNINYSIGKKDSLRVKMTRTALTDAALNQASWKDWYEEHQSTLDEFFGDNAQLFQDILSVTSQAASVKANVGLALKAFGQFHRGEEFNGFLPAVIQNLTRLREKSNVRGQKISAYKNSNDGKVDEAVIDRHIARLIFGVDSPSKAQFAKAQKILTEIANEIGWTPRQVQAALWAHSIYKSGKTPESYGAYLKKLESRGTLAERIGDIGRRSGASNADGGGRGRFAPESTADGAGLTNYSIASQSEIDRVNRALGGMNRGPDERLKVYERARQKFSRVMQENKEELDAIRSSVSTNTAPAIEQIEMDRAGRIADIEAEENTEVAKALQDNADTFLPRIEAAPTPAERKRVERDAKDRAKILEQGIRDKYAERKKSTDAEAKSQRDQTLQAAAAKDSAANARMRDKVRQTKLVNAIGELDGILKALPPEVRGRVGGFAVLANIGTGDKALADFFVKRIDMIDRQLERTLKEEYGNVFDALLERTKPKKAAAGEKPKGIGADIQTLFATVREARDWSAEKVDGHIANIETQIASGNLTAQEEAMLTREADLVSLVGDWKNADSSRRAAALSAATETWAKGMSTFVQKKIREREERDMARAEAISATGKKGDYVDRRKRVSEDNGLRGKIHGWFMNTISWDQAVNVLFGHESPMAIRLSDGQRKAEYTKIDAIQAKEDAVHDLFTKLAGGKRVDGERLMWKMSQPSISANGLNLSELEALAAPMMWAQEDGRRHMTGELDENGNPISKWHYDQQFIDDIESQLSPEAKAIRDFLLNNYGKEWFSINSVFREMNGINLPRIPNYSPITVAPINAPSGMVTDPVTGNAVSATSISPGALRTRGVAIAEPVFRNVVQTYLAHTRQMEHWKAFAPWIKEANGILRNRDVQNSIKEAGGEEATGVLNRYLDIFAQGGNRDASLGLEISKTMGGMASRAAQVALVGRVGTLAIQTTQIGAASAELPWGAYLSRLGKLVTGNLGWGDAINSKYIQRRIKQMPPTVQIAMEGLKAGKPNELKHQVEKIGQLISGTDALWTAGTYAMVYDYQLGQAKALGYRGQSAEDYAHNIAERITDRLAQPTRMGTRSIYELTATNPGARLAWAFASESRKNLALLAYTKANRPLKRFLAATAGYVVFNLAMGALIRNAWKDMRDDGDDEDDFFDEKTWNWKRMGVAMLTEPLQGMPLLGDYTEKGINAALGQYHQSSDLINFERGIKSFKNIPDILQGERDAEGVLKDIDGMVSLMGYFNQNAAAAASLTHIASDFFGVVDNATTED